MTIDTQGLRQLAKVLCIRTAVNGEMIEMQEAADAIDTLAAENNAQASEILRLRRALNKIAQGRIDPDKIKSAARAELEESSRALTLAGKTNKSLLDQHFRDSKELRRLCADRDKWRAQAKHETLCAKAAAEEVERLREALRWSAGALQAACDRDLDRPAAECDLFFMGGDSKTGKEILDMADAALGRAALQGESR